MSIILNEEDLCLLNEYVNDNTNPTLFYQIKELVDLLNEAQETKNNLIKSGQDPKSVETSQSFKGEDKFWKYISERVDLAPQLPIYFVQGENKIQLKERILKAFECSIDNLLKDKLILPNNMLLSKFPIVLYNPTDKKIV